MSQISFWGIYHLGSKKKLIRNSRENISKHKLGPEKTWNFLKIWQPEKISGIGRNWRILQHYLVKAF
jgi:hypothetical protein